MKKRMIFTCFVFAGALAIAQASSQPADVAVEFVSADSVKKTVTIKAEDGQQKTVPVEGKAELTVFQITRVTKGLIKAGDKITVTYRDNEKGEHQAITTILSAPAKTKSK